ncbi:hypothetical protein BOFE_08750 (plasmid) [Candidatus Borrelia fainii]|uniref:Lipoprotein n=1 Tax=Candidatus Borrelia fainii TaxID=2518322 RepID=A0ABM8DLD7_9SPIR|nr:hypothetical protein [Candidatus Borrelia fainii]BDU63335.1 hypothetical protein BOFE_08750 [Candidatus Borrelia fainii]
MQKLNIILFCVFVMMSCKQGELVTEIPFGYQAEDSLKGYSNLSQADSNLSSNKKPSVLRQSHSKAVSRDAAKSPNIDEDIKIKKVEDKGVVEEVIDKKVEDKGVVEEVIDKKVEDNRIENKKVEDEKVEDEKVADDKVEGKKGESQLEVEVEEQPPVPRKTAQEVYAEFESRVIKYKSKLVNDRNRLDPRYYSFNIPFKKVSPIFTSSEYQSDIYAAMGSDVSVIMNLERIFNNLDLKEPAWYTYGDTKIAVHLFNLLLNISEYTRKLVNVHLSSTNLEKIRMGKSVEDIITIDALLGEFIKEREKAINTVQYQIISLASKNKKEMLDGLKNTIGLSSGSAREIQHASYSIIGMVARIAYLVK